ncbi:hypothetical protein SUGI_0650520 [Cryptomeria japonica]|nr:hypothetical protein SUGI_0650520 [Cryptomeria japonica]
MVNVWAIGRDPSIWKNSMEFMPERFLEGKSKKIEYGGQNFELIPFEVRRRICLGLPLVSRMIYLVLASLLHSFEWILLDGMSCEEMDMSDEFGLSLKKVTNLQETKQLKEEKIKEEEKYMWSIVDGVKQKVGNFGVKPPELFHDWGEHPKV